MEPDETTLANTDLPISNIVINFTSLFSPQAHYYKKKIPIKLEEHWIIL